MEVHLFSSHGTPDLRDIISQCRRLLRGQKDPVVAYLPAASVGDQQVEKTQAAFQGVARVVTIDPDQARPEEVKEALDQASLLYVPGGNTYVLSQRLHRKRLVEPIKERIQSGLPLVAFSAGTVFCGQNILTANSLNACGCTKFAGLGLVPYNFNVHYPSQDGEARKVRDSGLAEYHAFHQNPVLALEEDAHLRVTDEGVELVRGGAWLFQRGQKKVKLKVGRVERP